jgi:hypothetical protein
MINGSLQFSKAEVASRMAILGTRTVPRNGFRILLVITYFCFASKIKLGEMDMQ